jgi:hypothetical protein
MTDCAISIDQNSHPTVGIKYENDLGLLSSTKLSALRCASEDKLLRTTWGWWSPKFNVHFHSSTILSLGWRGFLTANFEDPRGWGSSAERDQLAFERVKGGRADPLSVWATERGRIILSLHAA